MNQRALPSILTIPLEWSDYWSPSQKTFAALGEDLIETLIARRGAARAVVYQADARSESSESLQPTGDSSMTNLAAEKLRVAQEAARLGVSFTKPDERVLTRDELDVLFRYANAAFHEELVDDGRDFIRVALQITDRYTQSSVVRAEAETSATAEVIPFARKPEGDQ
jgi:hypothetical protein